MNRSRIAIFSPIAVILIGFIIAFILSPIIEEWAFVPLAFAYWAVIVLISYKTLGKDDFVKLFGKPERKPLWIVLSLVVGLIPLPIFLMNLELFNSPLIVAFWLVFAIINPFCEQVYWRGFMLSSLPFSKTASVLYSTLFFVLSHPLMWGVFSVGNRSWMAWASIAMMGIVWGAVYIKTKSLRWCLISHFLVNIFNLSVFVMLNIYIPPHM
jgi:membrane protease YdiL (CAAX protease family)